MPISRARFPCHADMKCIAANPCPRQTNVERIDTEVLTLSASCTRMSTTKLDEFGFRKNNKKRLPEILQGLHL